MALEVTYVSIRQRTNHLLCLHLIVDLTVEERYLLLGGDLIALTDVHRTWLLQLDGKALAAKLRRKSISEAYSD